MFFQHVYDKSLAQASYVIGCQKAGVAAVIDPKRDVDTYLEIAKANNLKITHIFETHIHADFLAGSRELAALTGAEMYLSDEGGDGWLYEFPHHGLNDGDVIKVGNLSFKVLHTPGHTPESISFLLTDHPASEEPVMLFTGDFVFVGDIGRPDLLEKAAGIRGTADAGAKEMYRSINKFSDLEDYIQVWPGHGAGSACGKALGAVPSTTVGYEKMRNWALQYDKDEEGFVKYLLEDQPEPPKYFAMMKKLNKVDRPLLTEVPELKLLSREELKEAMEKGYQLIDTRNKIDFAEGFIPGSMNIQNNNSFGTWCGWFLNYEQPFILLAPQEELDGLTRKLMRIGLDNIYGYIPSTHVFTEDEDGLETLSILSLEETKEKIEEENVQIVDVRGVVEYEEGHIKNAENIFIGTLPNNLDKFDKEKEILIYCQSGDRVAIAGSILAKNGFKNFSTYRGGMAEWKTQEEAVAV